MATKPDRKLVLLVEDDDELLPLMHAALSQHSPSLTYLTARSAEEALEVLELADVSVVVSDYRLPAVAGTELLAAIRARHPSVRRVLMTGDPGPGLATTAADQGGVDRLFIKPVDPAVLARVCEQLARAGTRPPSAYAEPRSSAPLFPRGSPSAGRGVMKSS